MSITRDLPVDQWPNPARWRSINELSKLSPSLATALQGGTYCSVTVHETVLVNPPDRDLCLVLSQTKRTELISFHLL